MWGNLRYCYALIGWVDPVAQADLLHFNAMWPSPSLKKSNPISHIAKNIWIRVYISDLMTYPEDKSLDLVYTKKL